MSTDSNSVKTSISLPKVLIPQMKARYEAKGFSSLSAYLTDLLRQDVSGNPSTLSLPPTATMESIQDNISPYLNSNLKANNEAIAALIQEMRDLTSALQQQAKVSPARAADETVTSLGVERDSKDDLVLVEYLNNNQVRGPSEMLQNYLILLKLVCAQAGSKTTPLPTHFAIYYTGKDAQHRIDKEIAMQRIASTEHRDPSSFSGYSSALEGKKSAADAHARDFMRGPPPEDDEE